MDRHAIIARLEQYWYDFYKNNPDEPMGDIPSAISWYWSIPMEHLLQEYNTYFG